MTGVKSRGMHLGFCATHGCDLMAKDIPCGGHPMKETRMTCGLSSLDVPCAWTARGMFACTSAMLAALPLSKPNLLVVGLEVASQALYNDPDLGRLVLDFVMSVCALVI
ncbi:hypothetical protein Tco_0575180 [Tanacetum coccineum]